MEVLVVLGIFTIMAGAILTFLTSSNRAWHVGQGKLREQQQARLAIENIANFLRRANPRWDSTHVAYSSEGNTRVDFYTPYFYADCCPNRCMDNSICRDTDGNYHSRGEISGLSKVTFKLLDEAGHPGRFELWMKEGISASRRIAGNIISLAFSCGGSGCTPGGPVDENSSYVNVAITTQENDQYILQSQIALRNNNLTVEDDISVQEPAEGEF